MNIRAPYAARLFTTVSIAVLAIGIVDANAGGPYPDTLPGGRINTGSADIFTVLAKGDASFTDNNITGPSMVTGNVGIGGQGNFTMSDGTINGDLYMNDFGTFKTSGPAKITGTVRGKNKNQGEDGTDETSVLNGALTDAQSLSSAAQMEAVTARYASIKNINITNSSQSMTITGNANEKVVLSLQNFQMSAGTFTLQGTATTSFIINVAQNFSLNNSSISLSGVPPQNVLFNILGSGGQVSLNQGTSMSGILLALGRKVDLSGGHVTGKVIANQVVITSGGSVVTPVTNR